MRLSPLIVMLCFVALVNDTWAQGGMLPVKAASEPSYPPLSIVDEDGNASGFAVELLREALSVVGRDVSFEVGQWSVIRQQLVDGKVEVLPLVGRTPEREAVYDFTFPYLMLRGAIFVRADNDNVRSIDDLTGVTIAVMEGDNAHEYVVREKLGRLVVTTPDFKMALKGLAAGEYDAVVMQKLLGLELMQQLGLGEALTAVGPPLEGFSQRFCFAVRKGNIELLAQLNEGLSIVIADGRFEELQTRWLARLGQDRRYRYLVRIFFAALITLAVGFWLAFLWQMMLRRRVSQRTGELNRANQELSELRDTLQQEIEERTEELEERNRRFDLALYGGNIATWEWDLETDRVKVDDRWCELLGIDVETFDPQVKSFNRRIHIEDRNRIFGLVEDVIAGNQPWYDAQVRLRQEQGGYRWFAVKGRVTRYSNENAPETVSGVLIDIHDRKRVEGQLLENRHLLQQLFDNIASGVAIYRPIQDGNDFEFFDINPAGCRLTRTSRSELIGKPVTEVFPAVRSMGLFAVLQKVHLTGETHCHPLAHYQDGRVEQWVENTVYRLPNGYIVALFEDTSEQRRAENKLRRSEANYRTLAVNLPDILIRFDAAGRVLYANPAAYHLLKIEEPEDVSARTLQEYGCSEAFVCELDRCIGRIFETGQPIETEFNLDAGQIFDCRLFPESGTDGEIASVLCVMRNISEQRRSEENYRMLFNQMQEGFAFHEMIYSEAGDPIDYRFIDVNPAFEKLTGLQRDKVVNQRVMQIMPDTEPFWIEVYGRVASTGVGEHVEHYSAELDKYFEVITFCPQPGFFACILRDTTLSHRVQERIQESEKRYRQLFDSSPISLWEEDVSRFKEYVAELEKQGITDLKRYLDEHPSEVSHCMQLIDVIDVNAATLSLYGAHSKEQLLGSICKVVDESSLPGLRLIMSAIAEERTVSCETTNLTLDGRVIDVVLTCVQLADENDVKNRIQLSVFDITQQRTLEEKLRHADKMRAIGELAGGIAHDFNNQLGGIMGYAGILKQRLDNPDLKGYASKIINVSANAANLASQLLTFARKGKYQSIRLDINLVIDDVIDMLRRTCDKKILIRSSLNAGHAIINGDPTMLQNALLNLGINARDAMPEGGVMTYSIENVSFTEAPPVGLDCGDYLSIRVMDTGYGMDEQTRQRIFEPFFTTKEEMSGTGLGLAAVFGAVEQHHGIIQVESTPGDGAVFEILLPLAEELDDLN